MELLKGTTQLSERELKRWSERERRRYTAEKEVQVRVDGGR